MGRTPSVNLRILSSSWVSRAITLLMLGMFTTLLIVACNGNAPNRTTSGDTANSTLSSNTSNCRIVKHDLGETQVCGQPQKIVALSPHLLDLLLSLDRQPAGYAEVFPFHKGKYFDNPSQQIPYLGDRVTSQPINLGNRDEPSLERLIELKPDLILGEVGKKPAVLDLLKRETEGNAFFLVEIGDKTQIATVALAARFDSLLAVVREAKVLLLTPKEVEYFRHGGILHYVLRQLASKKAA